MQRLQRIDQHAGDVATTAQHPQRILGHVLQGVGIARRHRVAHARLHVAPPAMIGAGKTHEVRSARVVAREPHRLHDRLGAGHVKRHLVEPGNVPQPLDVVGDRRMIGAEHRAKLARAPIAALQAVLVEVVAEEVHAVGAGQIVEAIAVEIGEDHSGGGLDERAGVEVLAHEAAVLERHAVGIGELQVGDAVPDARRAPGRLREPLAVERRKPHEPGAAARRDLLGRIVGAKEPLVVVFVERDERRDPPRHPGMPGQRSVLRARQLQARLQFRQRRRQRGGAEPRTGRMLYSRIHRTRCLYGQFYRIMTIRSLIAKICEQEDLNFLLTNRIPRRLVTRFMGWFSRIEQPLVRDLSIGVWRLFLRSRPERGEEVAVSQHARLLHPGAQGGSPAGRSGSRRSWSAPATRSSGRAARSSAPS